MANDRAQQMRIEQVKATSSAAETRRIRLAAAAALASAFRDDPVWNWVLEPAFSREQSPVKRKRMWDWTWESVAYCSARLLPPNMGLFLATDTTTEAPIGAQIWWPPEVEMSMMDLLTCGLATTPFRVGWKSAARIMELVEAMEPHHKELMPGPHCYLQVIGMHEDYQGKGFGSVMARHVLNSVDAANMPCYVESSNPLNITFYQRLGFQVVRQVRPGDCPPIDLLVRPPARTPIPVALSSFAAPLPAEATASLSDEQRATAHQITLLASGQASLGPSRLLRITFWFSILLLLLFLAYYTYDLW